MSTTPLDDPDRLAGVLAPLYEAAFDDDQWHPFLRAVATSLEADAAILMLFDHANERNSLLLAEGPDPAFGREFFRPWASPAARWTGSHEDHWWRRKRDLPAGTLLPDSALLDPALTRRNSLHQSLARPWDLDSFLLGIATNDAGLSVHLSFGRQRRRGPFTAREIAACRRRLLGPVDRSVRLRRRLAGERETTSLLRATTEQVPYGLIVFDAAGRVMHANSRAGAICSAGAGLQLRNGTLGAADPARDAQLHWSLAAALHGARRGHLAPPPTVLVPRPDPPGAGYRVLFAPMRTQSLASGLPAGTACLALIHPVDPAEPLATGLLAGAWGLTPAEARLCDLLLKGQPLHVAAGLLGISRNTAKTHLSRVFDKTGTRSQVALVRLLAGRGP